jgi:hypothetical protein
MSQLTENKQHGPVLIENFEPTACAGNSAQKGEVQERRRRLCADEPAQKVERGSRAGGTKKTGRAEALPVSLINLLQPDSTFSERARSTAWSLRASWPSLGFSLPCSCFLQFWCVQMVPLIRNYGRWYLPALTKVVNGLVASSFLAFFRVFFAMFLSPPFFFGRPSCLADAGHYAS